MPKTQRRNPSAVAYATALLELAVERGEQQEEAIGAELAEVRQVIEAEPTFRAFLTDPGIGSAERAAVVERAFKGRVSPLLWNTFGVLAAKGRLNLLPDLAAAYQELLDRRLGKVDVDVTVPRQLDEAELEQVRQAVARALGKQAVVRQREDPSLVGGIVLQVGDRLIDGSVKAQLESMRRRFLTAAAAR